MKKQQTLSAFLIFLAVTFMVVSSFAQVYEDKIYKSSIRSVVLNSTGGELTPPVINFNTDETLTLSFDDLEAGYQTWQYTFIHCNSDWTPTDLWQNEYLYGYTDDYIRDYLNSFNTLQPYTHYSLTFPNRDISFRIPGNYIIKVYPESQPDNPILTRKIYVMDKRVSVRASVKQALDINQRFTHQDLIFSILHPNYIITEPYSQLKVVVLQNQRVDNAKFNIRPLMIRDGELDYQYLDGTLTFEGGNEFRYVDLQSLNGSTNRIRSVEIRNDRYIVDLLFDKPRGFSPYITYQDINGKYLVRTVDAQNAADEGEYAWVNFFLPYEVPFPGSTMFIVGQFNDWRTDKSLPPELGRMNYNYARQGYEARLLLKQGYYDYMYALVDDKTGRIDFNQAEGNHSETVNSYTILVYNREQGYRYDRLIAVEIVEK